MQNKKTRTRRVAPKRPKASRTKAKAIPKTKARAGRKTPRLRPKRKPRSVPKKPIRRVKRIQTKRWQPKPKPVEPKLIAAKPIAPKPSEPVLVVADVDKPPVAPIGDRQGIPACYMHAGVRVGRLPPRGEPSHASPEPPVLRAEPTTPALKATLRRDPLPSRERLEALVQRLALDPLDSERERALGAALEGRDALVSLPAGLARATPWLVASQLLPQPTLVLGARPRFLLELHDKILQRRVGVVRFDENPVEAGRQNALEKIRGGGPLVILATPRALDAPDLFRAIAASGIGLVAIEDADAISPSSAELSPAYLGLRRLLTQLGRPPTLALFGPATPAVRSEIESSLGLRAPLAMIGRVLRDNVTLDAIEAKNEVRLRSLVELMHRLRRPGVVFAPTPHEVDAIYSALSAARLPVHRLHAGLPAGERAGEQLNFLLPGRRSILVATSAYSTPTGLVGLGESAELERAPVDFGLGLEKRDVRFVAHWAPPPSLEQYVREIALVGRDGEPATCVVLYDTNDLARTELRLSESRIVAHKLGSLAKTLGLSASDGHPRTLESLALSSGTSRRTAEAVCGVLEDAGLVSLSSGWCHTRVSSQVLAEQVGRLAAQLGRLRAEDERRVQAAQSYASTPECKSTALAAYFGEPSSHCGRCSSCRGNAIASLHSSSSLGSAPKRRRPAESLTFRMRLDRLGNAGTPRTPGPRPAPEISVVRGAASRSVR